MATIKQVRNIIGYDIGLSQEEAQQFLAWYQLSDWGRLPQLIQTMPPWIVDLAEELYGIAHG